MSPLAALAGLLAGLLALGLLAPLAPAATAAPTPRPTAAASTAAAKAATDATGTGTVAVSARLTGRSVGAWFGGPAKRTLEVTVTNVGSTPVTNPPTSVRAGRAGRTGTVIANPQLGTIAPGQSVQYRLPVTFKAPAFGDYRVNVAIAGLSAPAAATASTSSYPWLLFALAWLLLQPLLLGLYKRRPMRDDSDLDLLLGLPPVPEPTYSFDDDPLLAPLRPEPVAEQLDWPAPVLEPVAATVAVVAERPEWDLPVAEPVAVVAARPEWDLPVPDVAPPLPAPVEAVVAAPVETLVAAPVETLAAYRPVFGVNDLRAYLDPTDVATQQQVDARVVHGGVAVARAPQTPALPPAPTDQAAGQATD